MQKLRIVIADDHEVLCQCLTSLLNTQAKMSVVGTALRGETACQLVDELTPDILLLDLAMPGLGGAATTKRIKQLYPQTKVVVFSGHDDAIYVRRALENGASGYVLKSSHTSELLQAIQVVAAGGSYTSPSLTQKLNAASATSLENVLSKDEASILRLAAKGISNKEIAALLGFSIKTVETYKTRINKKMNFDSRVDLVRYALTHGFLCNETTQV